MYAQKIHINNNYLFWKIYKSAHLYKFITTIKFIQKIFRKNPSKFNFLIKI